MDEHLDQLQITKTKRIFNSVLKLVKAHKVKTVVGLILLLIIFVGVIKGDNEIQEAQAVLKQVEVINVSELVSDGGQVPVVGTLKANQQIDLHPQIGGQVSVVHVKLDQQVVAGQILVEVNHRDMDASVAQASASLQSAVAAYNKMKNGARPEDTIIAQQNLNAAQQQLNDMKNGGRSEEIAQAQTSVDLALKALDDANTNFVNTETQNVNTVNSQLENAIQAIKSAQIAEDKVLEQDLANIYSANNGDKLIPVIQDLALEISANNLRDDIGFQLYKWESSILVFSATSKLSVIDALNTAETNLNSFLSFLSITGNALQEALATSSYSVTDLSTAKISVNAARIAIKANLDGIITYRQTINNQDVLSDRALEGARTQIDNAKGSHDNAKEQLQIIKDGATAEQIAIQEARVAQAEQQLLIVQNGARVEDLNLQRASIAAARASLALAAANRDKAIIRAPLAGAVTYIPVEIGDIISSASIAVSIANKDGLEVETFVSENERAFISVGNEVLINETIKGVVQEIAPALDPINRKVEIKVTVVDEAPNLTLGETVNLQIQKVAPEVAMIKVPLSAVKIKSTGAELYKVTDENQLETINVEVGEVSGGSIEILTQLEDNTRLVKDLRGFKSGQEVVVR